MPKRSSASGLSLERLARIAPAMQAFVDRGQVAGVLTLVARRGEVAHEECFGLADLEAKAPMRPDTIFRIWSMSKPITCVAALMLWEEGAFALLDPVSQYLPEFKGMQVLGPSGLEPLRREVTVRDLFTHTSGLSYPDPQGSPAERLLWQSGVAAEAAGGEDLAQWLARICCVPLNCQPGSRFQYGHSHDVLGRLIEVLSGQAFDVFLQERLFGPLGMADTGFHVPAAKAGRFSAQYALDAQGRLQLDDPPAGRWARPRRFLGGGGDLVSSTRDYLRFCQMLLNMGELDGVRILGRKTVELMTLNHLPPPPLPSSFGGDQYDHGYGYGLGVRVLLDVARSGLPGSVGEYGWAGYAGTYFWIDPVEQMIGLVMPQIVVADGVPFGLAERFRALAYQAIMD